MEFPETVEHGKMEDLVHKGRGDRIHPIFTDGKVVVPDMERATVIAFFSRGTVSAKYSLKGDGNWKRVSLA